MHVILYREQRTLRASTIRTLIQLLLRCVVSFTWITPNFFLYFLFGYVYRVHTFLGKVRFYSSNTTAREIRSCVSRNAGDTTCVILSLPARGNVNIHGTASSLLSRGGVGIHLSKYNVAYTYYKNQTQLVINHVYRTVIALRFLNSTFMEYTCTIHRC